MYESLNVPVPDTSEYLGRIGMACPPRVDLGGLNALIWHHQTHVPFEDLNSSYLKAPVPLDIPSLYDKVVTRRRGGYCFELNGLFTRLLTDLGFDARSVFCRVVRGRDFLPPCAHRGVVVAIEGIMYFCDVGFGGPMPAAALPLRDGHWETIHGEGFQINRFDDYWWTISRITSDGAREAVLQFNTFPQLPQEFLTVNEKWSTDPDSPFVSQRLVNLRTEDGFLSVTGDVLTIKTGSETQRIPLPDDAAFRHALSTHFGINGLEQGDDQNMRNDTD